MAEDRSGHCLCGAISFRTSGPLRGVVYCHCSQCRRQTGHFYAATNIARDRIEISGTANLAWYRASDEASRGFCTICGSALFWQSDGSAEISVMAGSFDQPTGLEATGHIFVADKGDYYEIEDGLPQRPASS